MKLTERSGNLITPVPSRFLALPQKLRTWKGSQRHLFSVRPLNSYTSSSDVECLGAWLNVCANLAKHMVTACSHWEKKKHSSIAHDRTSCPPQLCKNHKMKRSTRADTRHLVENCPRQRWSAPPWAHWPFKLCGPCEQNRRSVTVDALVGKLVRFAWRLDTTSCQRSLIYKSAKQHSNAVSKQCPTVEVSFTHDAELLKLVHADQHNELKKISLR